MSDFNWTPERIDELMRLVGQGLTSYQLARHFGVTRNAICGRVYRERQKRGIPARPRTKAHKQRKAHMLTLADRADSVTRIVAPPLPVPDQEQLASIVDVTGCKWPVKDDPSFVGGQAFCNHKTEEGASYCPYHKHQAIAPYSQKLIKKTLGAFGLRFQKRAA